jgi:hypothetical protein
MLQGKDIRTMMMYSKRDENAAAGMAGEGRRRREVKERQLSDERNMRCVPIMTIKS